MEERLNELIRLFHEGKVVEKIAKSTNKVKTYKKQKQLLKDKIDRFKEDVLKYYNLEKDVVFDDYDILPEDALQICLICIMAGINDDDLFGCYEDLPIVLRQVEGKLSDIAEEISYFLDFNEESQLFSEYEEEELIERFFD